ncbi:MAG: EAL domain-containing protein [Campylobacterota bacterium]|nr:EAL domain-containing protein [Campylobacterota bacterium]
MEYESILAQYKDAVDKSSIFSKADSRGRITYVNDKFCEISGYSRDELLGHNHSIIKDSSTPKALFKEMWNDITKGKVWNGVLKNKKKDGGCYYVNSTIYPIKDESGNFLEYISIRQDITELIKSQKLLEIYSTDTITHLPNRQKLNERLKSNSDELMSIILDIKEFTLINELYGDSVGDEILLKVSLRLIDYLANEGVTLYRLDSDRYLILVDDKNLFTKYESLIEFTFLSEDDFIINDIAVSFNIGVAYGSADLLNKSSLALKEAKKRKNRFFVYNDSIDTKKLHQKNLKRFNDFKDALLNDRIEPFFQPIVDAKTEKIVKYESLARIIDRDNNIIAVADFLEIAEKSSFFENFTRQMIQKIFAISNASNQEVTINLTYENINSAGLVKYIQNRLQMHKGPRITFEILESEEISDYTVLEDFVDMVKEYGSLIAIDDFGTGYSNFAHLAKFKADFIKIDGSIINNLESDENHKLILSILIEYANKNNIKTIAEYVSSAKIANIVKELGVDLLQGYYYGKPENAKYYNLSI